MLNYYDLGLLQVGLKSCDEWFWLKIEKEFKFGFENVLK